MASDVNSVIQPIGLVHGHSECRYLDETIPVLTQVLALDLIEQKDGQAVLKHPTLTLLRLWGQRFQPMET